MAKFDNKVYTNAEGFIYLLKKLKDPTSTETHLAEIPFDDGETKPYRYKVYVGEDFIEENNLVCVGSL